MNTPTPESPASCCLQYELDIPIKAPVGIVWKALIDDIQAWWLKDFHMVGADSTVAFDTSPGGKGLIEVNEDGSFLQWYQVQRSLPAEHRIYLVGHLAADYGGPATSHLRLTVETHEQHASLNVSEAYHGNADEDTLESLRLGWQQLFGDGLKAYVESL